VSPESPIDACCCCCCLAALYSLQILRVGLSEPTSTVQQTAHMWCTSTHYATHIHSCRRCTSAALAHLCSRRCSVLRLLCCRLCCDRMCVYVLRVPRVHTPHIVNCQGSKVPAAAHAQCHGMKALHQDNYNHSVVFWWLVQDPRAFRPTPCTNIWRLLPFCRSAGAAGGLLPCVWSSCCLSQDACSMSAKQCPQSQAPGSAAWKQPCNTHLCCMMS
jgi:hypothetical protein